MSNCSIFKIARRWRYSSSCLRRPGITQIVSSRTGSRFQVRLEAIRGRRRRISTRRNSTSGFVTSVVNVIDIRDSYSDGITSHYSTQESIDYTASELYATSLHANAYVWAASRRGGVWLVSGADWLTGGRTCYHVTPRRLLGTALGERIHQIMHRMIQNGRGKQD